MRVRTLGSVVVVVLALAGCERAAKSEPANSTPKPVPAPPERRIVPALTDESEGFAFDVETRRVQNPDGRRLRLLIRTGDVTLTLFDPSPNQKGEIAFGRGELSSPNAASGGEVVGAVARWLHRKPPAAPKPPGALRPFAINYVNLGSDGQWEANKLFLQDGAREAEVFLNIRADGKRAFLLEKDEDYRRDLVSLLATALRDGKPPRKTSGRELAGPEPLVPSLAPIAGPGMIVSPQAWVGGAWIAVVESGPNNRVLLWNDLAKQPRLLAEVKGDVNSLAVSPRRDRVALLVIHPARAGSLSSADPGEVLVAPVDGGPARMLVAAQPDFTVGMMSRVVWSPDGAALAVNGMAAAKGLATLARAYDVATGRVLAGTRPEPVAGIPVGWEGDAVVLLKWGKKGRETVRWRPGKGEPIPDRHRAPLHSPDGRYTVALRSSGLEIADPSGHRTFKARGEEDRGAMTALSENAEAPWLGAGALVLDSDSPVALDLATAKLRYLFPEGKFTFVGASDDGQRVVARDADGRLVWGRVAR